MYSSILRALAVFSIFVVASRDQETGKLLPLATMGEAKKRGRKSKRCGACAGCKSKNATATLRPPGGSNATIEIPANVMGISTFPLLQKGASQFFF